jgi:hypothetical protein
MECSLTPDFIISIIKIVEQYIRRKLTDIEENNVINLIKNIPPGYLSGLPHDKLKVIIIDTVIEDLNLKFCEMENIDVHEILKQTISKKNISDNLVRKEENGQVIISKIDSFFGIRDITELIKTINEPGVTVNKVYLLLDSRYRFLENDGTDYFKWGCISNYVRSQGTVNFIGDLKDIIGIHMSNFTFPSIKDEDVFKYNRVSILVSEFESQSFIGHEDRRFHFMAQPIELDTGHVEMDTRTLGRSEYHFNDSIVSLDTITISFGNPLERIKFDKDRLDGCFCINGNLLLIQFDENHNLKSGDYVYTEHYKINKNSTLEKKYINLINIINNTRGLQCYVNDSTSIYLYYQQYKHSDDDDVDPATFILHNNTIKNKLIFIDDPIDFDIVDTVRYNVFFGSKRLFLSLQVDFLF